MRVGSKCSGMPPPPVCLSESRNSFRFWLRGLYGVMCGMDTAWFAHCDNQAVMACVHAWWSKYKRLMHLLRNQLFVKASFSFCFHPQYIDTHSNHLADDLSRNHILSFLSKVPPASFYPTLVPTGLVDLLLDSQADWTSALEPVVQHYFNDGLAKSTQRTYNTVMKRFYSFSVKYNVFSLSEHTLTLLLCCLFNR